MTTSDTPATTPSVALYHVMKRHEGFEQTAQILWGMVRHATTAKPGQPRALFLDIEGHRNAEGGLDADALEIVQEFGMGALMPYLTTFSNPLMQVRNPGTQSDDMPEMEIQS